MAQTAGSEGLNCPICLEIPNDPVTLPCGDSYCMDCIQKISESESLYLDFVEELTTSYCGGADDQQGVLIAPPADDCYAGPGDVSCDLCTDRKLKAVRSCLQCLVSYCKSHLQPHYEVAVFQRHPLVAPSKKLHEDLCSQHKKLKDLFCRTDQQLLCSLCSVDQHRGHDTVLSAAERAQRQAQLEANRALLQQQLQDKETEQERLQEEAQDISLSAQTAVQRSGDTFREMALLLEKRRSEVEQQIHSEEQLQLKQVQDLQDQLQRDITELKKTISELDTLSLTPDHNQFILHCPLLASDTEKTQSKVQTRARRDFEDVTRAVSALRDQLQLSLTGLNMFEYEPSSREDFLRYASDITLDPNTVNKLLSLSDENRRVERFYKEQSYPDHPDRFVDRCQVLSTEGLTGRRYWEVEFSGSSAVRIAVSYRDIERNGKYSVFGNNDKSWALNCNKNSFSFWFNNVSSEVLGPMSDRIGVYLDHSAGALSFYSVKDENMTLLHRVQTSYTQSLYPGVRIGGSFGDTAHFLKLK